MMRTDEIFLLIFFFIGLFFAFLPTTLALKGRHEHFAIFIVSNIVGLILAPLLTVGAIAWGSHLLDIPDACYAYGPSADWDESTRLIFSGKIDICSNYTTRAFLGYSLVAFGILSVLAAFAIWIGGIWVAAKHLTR